MSVGGGDGKRRDGWSSGRVIQILTGHNLRLSDW